jgi:tol-pal system protein YbgF
MSALNLIPLGFFCVFSFLLFFQPLSYAGLFDDVEARRAILDLRQKTDLIDQTSKKEIQALREENAQLRRSLFELQSSIEMLRVDKAKQSGEFEQLLKDVSELQRRHRDQAQVVEDRIRRFEPQRVSLDGRDFSADPAEVREYEAALGQLRKNDFKAAAQGFSDFLRRYPQTGYQSHSLFWLGSAQFALREYKESIASFRLSIDSNPTSSRAPEAMLAMANAHVELKNNRNAKKMLEDLLRTYPKSEAASAGKERLSRMK